MFRQVTLFGSAEPDVDRSFHAAQRRSLDDSSWIEYVPGWLSGADTLFDAVVDTVALRQRHDVVMYDRVVDEPRLTAWWSAGIGGQLPVPVLDDIRALLSERYGRPFDSIGFNLYRDGNDSVAWHGDRHRHHVEKPVVAILSVGARRSLRLRPRGGGASRGWALGHGDLFVMGGACQHCWEHTVTKQRSPVGPRLSMTYRHDVLRAG